MLRSSYSTIDTNELLSKIVSTYNIERLKECLFWERGANDTYKIMCVNETYFLRVYRLNVYELEAIEFEARFLDYLHQNGFPVAFPIRKKAGGFITEVAACEGARYILVTAMAEGEAPDYTSLDQCRLVGESLAQMHLSSLGFETKFKRHQLDLQWLLEDSLSVIQAYLADQPKHFKVVEASAQKARGVVEPVLDSLDFGICHGDFHGGNLHVHKSTVTHFDFEECAFGYRIYDLATFKWGACAGKQGPERWSAFVNGYKSVRPLTEVDFSVVDSFVVIRELAETAYGIRHVKDFGHNGIIASDIDQFCDHLKNMHTPT